MSQQKDQVLQSKESYLNLRSLDVLRGLLAVYVLAGHCRWLLWTGYETWKQLPHTWWEQLIAISSAGLRYGHEAVMIFFVLSGFFIHLRVAKQLAQKSSFKFNLPEFIRRRSHRLIPPYLFALSLTIVVDLIGIQLFPILYKAITGDALLDLNFIRKGYSIHSVLPALLLLPSSLGKDFGSNGPLWSLAYEIIFYALYPTWLVIRRQSWIAAYPVTIGACMIINHFLPVNFFTSVLFHYPIWLCGAVIAERSTKQNNFKLQNIFVSILLILSLVYICFIKSSTYQALVYSALGTGIVIAFLSVPEKALKNLFFKALEAIGIRSYTIYVCHFPIVTLASAWSIETTGTRPTSGWFALAIGGITLLICCLCFEICEHQFLHSRIRA